MPIDPATLWSLLFRGGSALAVLTLVARWWKKHKASLIWKPGKFQITWRS